MQVGDILHASLRNEFKLKKKNKNNNNKKKGT